MVFLELKRQGWEIFFHKQRYECDFILRQGIEIASAIQVTLDLDDVTTKQREVNGLLDAMQHHNLNSGLILTESSADQIIVDHRVIDAVPIWQWLLT